jgi:uncharacterized protein (TIGR02996 family)
MWGRENEMAMIHPELKTLLATVCDKPTDATAKLVLADWLDENGYCGEAMRWASKWRKNPSQEEGGWNRIMMIGEKLPTGWFFGIARRGESWRADVVPGCVFGINIERPDTQNTNCLPYKTPLQSWLAFIVAFDEAYKNGKIGRKRKTKETTV